MRNNCINELLPYVQKPSRYLGSEINRIQKDLQLVKLKFALAFPDLYEIGSSHFGLQILYHVLNQDDEIAAERVFAPADDMAALLRERRMPLSSLESRLPLAEFDIIGFSLLYELNYTNVIEMLDLAGLPPRWSKRGEEHPLIIAGGPCVSNPEPMAEFFDAMVFGDGEELVPEMSRVWMTWKAGGAKKREQLLLSWSRLEGVYVPRFFKARFDEHGFQRLLAVAQGRDTVSRAIVADLNQASFPDRPIIPYAKPVHDRLRMEISRGCTGGCRFCQAGMIYRPVRERAPERVFALVQEALSRTGYEDLSLLSLSTGDYTCLAALMERLMRHCRADHVAVSLPSLRAGSITPQLMELIRSVRKTGFTIAPEAGSQRLRDVINKNITYADVAANVKDAFELGWRVIKLYYMIGLPTETDEDIDAIVQMVRELRKIKGPGGRQGQINVSVTTFIPKAHTPFQWCAQLSIEASKAKIAYLKTELKMAGVRLKWQLPEMSLLEGVLARGDRRLADVVEQAWKNGARFDGWTDRLKLDYWMDAFEQTGVGPDQFILRERNVEDPLPWAHMDSRVEPQFLESQWLAAHGGETLQDCRHGLCHDCGVCDFTTLEPVVYDRGFGPNRAPEKPKRHQDNFIWLELIYSKMGPARFFGHLEMRNVITRAVRRARIGVKYSQGFHPMPQISFDDPLPLGLEAQAERMRMLVSVRHACKEVMDLINGQLPEGLRIIDCRLRPSGKSNAATRTQNFRVHVVEGKPIDTRYLNRFWRSERWIYRRENRKGRKIEFDLRKQVKRLELEDDKTLYMQIRSDAVHLLRAADVLCGIFQIRKEQLPMLRMVKLAG